jgi:GNAT superfamily N-acetyltransferase
MNSHDIPGTAKVDLPVEFRSSGEPDLEAVISWIGSANECLAWSGPGVAYPMTLEGLKEQIAYTPENSYCLSDDGRTLAFGQLLEKGEHHFHLARIIVAPEARGRGYGRNICRRLIDRARSMGARGLTLNVYRDNLTALTLYRDLGFEPGPPPETTPLPAEVVHMRWQGCISSGGHMENRCSQIINGLEANLANSVAFFSRLTPQQLETEVYGGEVKWTARQILAHFATIEGTMHWLFKDIQSGGPGSPPDFDVDRFNRSQVQKLDGHGLTELIEIFESVRKRTIAIVSRMTDADLDREGRHAFHGHGKLDRFIRWACEHVDLHIEDIRKALDQG